jgi:hypothetical protein
MKIKTGDISIVENAGTFLLWYDNYVRLRLTLCFPFDTIRPLCGAVLSSSSSSLF